MSKLIPNPPITDPTSPSEERLLNCATERAFAHDGLDDSPKPSNHHVARYCPSLSMEDKLVTTLSILQSAAATAYESADQLDGSRRRLAMGVVHLIELAESWLNAALDEATAARTAS
ncbi:hypothetical protein NLK61_18655 [Pseudomonas fuscovaginae UPB0736]|uniref:DUF3077 domain-containing protein n=1 Tax=Pseudomonas asplenii TaxID=53407 RepID=A0A1H6MZQ5_9PSED|nr:hypothetical protein [Pseudomonas fuscovaginae]UUQ63288.1 hypothetical protein NLK61_18655 [Pseudomonas fuscovaginae UPB0736]SEI05350.1 hypothetical protein SAMN05216581_1598 [Pseudomonas fuscovaginae]